MTDPILTAWLTVIARDGWVGVRIDAVAEVAGVTTAAVAAALPDRWSALAAFARDLDTATLAEAGADREASVRDRLFTLFMARFDAAQPWRGTVRALSDAARRDPGLAAFAGLDLSRSIARLAEAAGVPTGGLTGLVRAQALTVVYVVVARVWRDDDSADLAATMKELDTRLASAETWARRLPHRAPQAAATPVVPSAETRSSDGLPGG